ncbi:nucleotide sugar dehydrogenase [Alphaproteobacteria bacterium]|nr:nucleotide sugar dehydrogenase [Alphaproteobacteria bacterium]
MKNKNKISVIGLGYVGLPLALAFSKIYRTIGYDIQKARIQNLQNGIDSNNDISLTNIKSLKKISFTSNLVDLKGSDFYIICVPTPVDYKNEPDLKGLIKATKDISKIIKKNDIVIYESTVFPGATDEVCIPIIEQNSGLKINKDFYCGYSPERINPGDKIHKLTGIKKIVSGSNNYALNKINNLYQSIIKAGTHKVPNIKIAEAAKIIENTQRDLNIALMNEFSMFLNKMNINTSEVLKAANTKWNFLNFKPGLVGGHCIGVDPYYLTYKAKKIGIDTKVILSGRYTNDTMFKFIFLQIKKILKFKNIHHKNIKILFLGTTFKENVSDIRNSQVIKLINIFAKITSNIDIYDPYVKEINNSFKANLIINKKNIKKYNLVIHAVKHKNFKSLYKFKNYNKLLTKNGFVYDIHNLFEKSQKIIFL